MAVVRRAWLSYRRAIGIYLLAIVGPTLLLLYLGLQSVTRQRQALAALTASNLRLSGEKLAAELERRVHSLAESCLRDPEMPQIPARADQIRSRHPVARHFFVIKSNAVRYPLLRTPPPRRQESFPMLAAAEELELRQQRPDLALAAYQKCYQQPVADSLKALALARTARCLQKLDRIQEAQQTYRSLAERYGDLYDAFHRPYGVIAALELGQWSSQALAPLREDLARGRWELSAEQLEYFLAKLEERLPGRAAETEYLKRFQLGRALEEGFRHQGSLRRNEVYAFALGRGEAAYQTYYTLHRGADDGGTLVGLAVDFRWVQDRLLPQARKDLQIGESVKVRWNAGRWEASVASDSSASQRAASRRDLLVFAGTTLLILAVLVLGVALLIRDVWRDLELSRIRSDFMSGVSHELKTPLTVIRLYAETLFDRRNVTEEQRRSFYQIIMRESDRLSHLIENVLDFARIERGRKQYRFEEADLAATVARTVDVYGEHLRRRGFDIETALAAELPPMRFDPDAVSQAVVNLLDNAAKYSGETQFVGIRLWSQDGKVVFEVEDRGVGIPATEQERIFQQFYRVQGNSGKGGHGLGLYLVRHIMEAHGGCVEVASEVGRGSRFRLVFPLQSAVPSDN